MIRIGMSRALPLVAAALLLAGPVAARAVAPPEAAPAAAEASQAWNEARRLADAGRFADALSVLRAELARRGDDFGLRWLEAGITGEAGRHRDAVGLYEKLALDHPARAQELLPDLAGERLAADDAKGAVRDYRLWLQSHPDDAPARRQLAASLARADSLPPALAAYDTLLAHEPGDVELLLGRAQTLAWMGRHEAAIAAYRAVLARQPGNADARLGEAMNLNWSGRHRAATQSLEAITNDPSADVAAGKALAFARWWDGDVAGARIAVDDYLRREPADAEALQLSRQIAKDRSASLRFEGGRADDSDGLRDDDTQMELRVPFAQAATAWLRWRRDNLRDQGGTRDPLRLTAGLQQAFGAAWVVRGEFTHTDWNDGPGTAPGGELGIVSRPLDRVRLEAVVARSPVLTRRSMALGISLLEWTGAADLGLRENLSLHVDGHAGFYSDHNGMERAGTALAWKAISHRNTDLTLDVAAAQLHTHFDPGNGYYAPSFHREWGPGAEAEWRPSPDWTFGATGRAGWQHDRDAQAQSVYSASARAVYAPPGAWSLDLEGGRSDSSLETDSGYRRNWWQAGITRGF